MLIDLTPHFLADQALIGSKSEITKSYSDTSNLIYLYSLKIFDDRNDFDQFIDPDLL